LEDWSKNDGVHDRGCDQEEQRKGHEDVVELEAAVEFYADPSAEDGEDYCDAYADPDD